MHKTIPALIGANLLGCAHAGPVTPVVAGDPDAVRAGEPDLGGGGAGEAPRALPAALRWRASGPLLVPNTAAHPSIVAVKDPTVVQFEGRWHLYASSVSAGGVYGMVYASFASFDEVASTTFYPMARTPGFDTYVAAPQLFYFAPQRKWYLVFQSGPPMFSTNDHPGRPEAWTPPEPFFAETPPGIEEAGGWLDYWVICDDQTCSLFFSNDHGRWYRSVTRLADFPCGFGAPEVVLEDAEAGRLYEACNVYRLQGREQYVALIEAFDATSSYRRYFRSWTASSLDGPWTPWLDSGERPFAGPSNVDFSGPPWTRDISHGELLRAGYDQTLTVDPDDLRFLIQGHDPAADGRDYNSLPWRLGLLSSAP